jgi:hypothetical protein
MEPTNILPIVAVFLLPAVAYGGWALLTAYTGTGPGARRTGRLAEAVLAGRARPRRGAARALVGLPALPAPRRVLQHLGMDPRHRAAHRTSLPVRGVFLHLAVDRADKPSAGTKLTRGGALLIAAALITLAVGLIQTA